MTKPVRRIVTGFNEAGRSAVIMDGAAPNVRRPAFCGEYVSTLVWLTDRAPASNAGLKDMAPIELQIASPSPHRGGTVFRITDIPPDESCEPSKVDMTKGGLQVTEEGRQRHFLYHRSDTVDYAIVLEGEIWAILDEGETLLTQGDVLIQRGTGHAWSNRSNSVCRMAFVLIHADPIGTKGI